MQLPRRHFIQASASLVTSSLGLTVNAQSASAIEAKAPDLPAVGTALQLPKELTLLDGKVFSAAQAQGQILVIYWWASWCPYCAQQSPEIQKLWQQQGAKGLRVLALSIDNSSDKAKHYLRQKGYSFPAAHVTPAIQHVLPKPKGLPVLLVRGRDGKVLQAEKGQMFPEDVALLGRWLTS